ncbi:hypothetical protein F9B85_13820 [Heliorestis acidaminivorans]|uniref:Uncharacterized protein n=1 Tax=Heliorestis acidaminivorans TaxID=553427 RepID=A0A6I0EPD0_9FIRM|nr:hypothetical protein [Heliorestis acidaminivorans]KAB2950838.1 hypothetical protein F9B85_13820 [Heliorestis acidaminivorans]
MNIIQFATPMAAAQSIAKLLDGCNSRFVARPWNRYEPENSLWWVVPSNKWPAYQYGKYVFWNVGNHLLCGIHVEKGFDQCVGPMLKKSSSQNLIIKQDWVWHRFLKDIEKGIVDASLQEIQKNCNVRPQIHIGAGLLGSDSTFDPSSPRSDELIFEYDNGELKICKSIFPFDTITPLKTAKKLNQIPKLAPSIGGINWTWIDFYIVIPFIKPNSENRACSEVIDGMKLYNMVLSRLEQWVFPNN